EETALGSNKETDWKRTEAHQVSPSLMQVPTRRGVHRFQTGRVDLTAKRTNDVLRKPDNLTSYRQEPESAPDPDPAGKGQGLAVRRENRPRPQVFGVAYS